MKKKQDQIGMWQWKHQEMIENIKDFIFCIHVAEQKVYVYVHGNQQIGIETMLSIIMGLRRIN